MKITAVKTIPLGGSTHDHGWPGGTDPNVQYNTLIEVIGEDGFVGIGSCYTSRQLVEGSLALLLPHMIGECALEPERLSEKLRQSMFWLGRGGSVRQPPAAQLPLHFGGLIEPVADGFGVHEAEYSEPPSVGTRR